jgi:hypothetical protein
MTFFTKRASFRTSVSGKDLKTNGNKPENSVKRDHRISFCKNSSEKPILYVEKDRFFEKVIKNWKYKEFHATAIKGTV